jgi:diguanylate cyclase (GGDEF)-like protein
MSIELSEQQRLFVQRQIDNFWDSLIRDELNPVQLVLRYRTPPPSIQAIVGEIERWRALWQMPVPSDNNKIDLSFAPLIKSALLARRRVVATDVDERRTKTLHPEALASLDGELAEFDDFTSQDWFQNAAPLPIPRLAEFLTLQEVERLLQIRQLRLADREFDEKFHLLQAFRLLLPDLAFYRETSGVRGNPVALAFVDIDDFKRLNTKYGHKVVDEAILPIFMRRLEAFTFARGYSYRIGGDEYGVLLGNGKGAQQAFTELLSSIAELTFTGIEERLSVSIGLCTVPADSDLSEAAIYGRANRAMRYAKDHGKSTIATYANARMREEDLLIVSQPSNQRNVSNAGVPN